MENNSIRKTTPLILAIVFALITTSASATVKISLNNQQPDTSQVYRVVDQLPKMIGGMTALQNNMIYPESAKKDGTEGRVILEFVVNKSGDVENPVVKKGLSEDLNSAAISAISKIKFEPGLQKEEPVKVLMTLPIIFKLDN